MSPAATATLGRRAAPSVWLSAAVLLAAAAVGGLAMGLVYGQRAGELMAAFSLLGGAPVVIVTHLVARSRRRLGSLSRQLVIGIAVAVGLALAGLAVVGLLMFVSPHDAFTMALLLALGAALSGYCAWLLGSRVLRDVELLGRGLTEVGRGARTMTIETGADDELAELAAAANRMTAQLAAREAERDAAEQARRDLIAAISHDLRTPLASLQVLAEALEDDLVDEATRRRYLARISANVRTLSNLIEDLFELSRLAAGELRWSMQQVNLGDLVEETLEAMAAEAEAKQVSLRTQVASALRPARANPEKVQRVLFNLVQNAIRHTPPDGTVTVAAAASDRELEIEVADTGHGIEPDLRDRVFEPFFRGGADSARTADGAGLGLTICRVIVEAHGGRIWVAGGEPGTRVRFSLPTAR